MSDKRRATVMNGAEGTPYNRDKMNIDYQPKHGKNPILHPVQFGGHSGDDTDVGYYDVPGQENPWKP
jgi:hypothetical protein